MVIRANAKPHGVLGRKHEAAVDRPALAARFLIKRRLVQTHGLPGSRQLQIALRRELHAFCAVHAQANPPRIGARSYHKVVLQLLLAAVIDQVDAGIDALVANPCVVRDISAPFRRGVAYEVVALSRQFLDAGHLGIARCTHESHAQRFVLN